MHVPCANCTERHTLKVQDALHMHSLVYGFIHRQTLTRKFTLGIFHCDGCGICRIGSRELLWHCSKCVSCLPNSISKETHAKRFSLRSHRPKPITRHVTCIETSTLSLPLEVSSSSDERRLPCMFGGEGMVNGLERVCLAVIGVGLRIG